MTVFLDYLRQFSFGSAALRLALAMAAGGAVGYGRARKQRNAGLRTYMLVSVGAALAVLLSLYETEMLYGDGAWAWVAGVTELKFDASRYGAQVITGIGFLAAGTILAVSHQQVSGLTSAIGLFAAACLGLAAGAGFFECVAAATALLILSMETMQPLEVLFKRRLRNITISVEFTSVSDIATVTEALEQRGAQIFDIDVEREEQEKDLLPSAIFAIKLSREKASHSEVISSLAEMPCVYSVQELIS